MTTFKIDISETHYSVCDECGERIHKEFNTSFQSAYENRSSFWDSASKMLAAWAEKWMSSPKFCPKCDFKG